MHLILGKPYILYCRYRCGRDSTIGGLTTTYAISAYQHWSWEFEYCSGEV